MRIDTDQHAYVSSLINKELASGEISEKRATELLGNLQAMGYLDEKSERLCCAAITDRAIKIPANIRDKIRANILKEMLLAL